MNTSGPVALEDAMGRNRLATLLEQLQASCSPRSKARWLPYFCVVCCGVVAALQGRQFLILYLGVFVVVFMLQGFSDQRTRKQIDLLVQLVQELERRRNP